MSKHAYTDPSEYVDHTFTVTLTMFQDEEPPTVEEIRSALYQALSCLSTADAVDVVAEDETL